MAASKVRIGFVGCGGIGGHHLKVWQKIEDAEIVAVCDIVEERARNASETYGGEVFTDMAEMLKKADIDAVDICTWSGLHAQQALMAIEAGKHAMVEKPIDIDIKKVDRLLEVAEKSGLILACIFNNRAGKEIQRAKQLIDEGALGKIISGSTYIKWWRAQSYYDSDAWRGTWMYDGGCFSNQGIHAIDQLCWMCGPVKEVNYCHIETAMHRMEAEDVGIAMLTFENGAHGVIEATTCCFPGMGLRTEVYGTKGSAVFDGSRVVQFKVQDQEIDLSSEAEAQKSDGRADPLSIGLGGHEAQLADFVSCIKSGGQPMVTGRDARLAVDCLTKMYNKAGITKLGT
jgi:UDP-N-acetyl-2-amino-2-deoxyglucuronate dehydrogenase